MNIAETAAIVNALNSGGGGGASDGGYDVVVKFSTNVFDNLTTDKAELVKGDYATARDLALAGKPIRCLVYGVYIYDEGATYVEFPIINVYCDPGYNDNLQITIVPNEPAVEVRDGADTSPIRIYGASTQFKHIQITESGLALN